MSELPNGWYEATIADVTGPFAGIDPTKTPTKLFKYVDIGSIDNKTQTIADPKVIKGADAPSRARRVIHSGDTLFSTVRTYLKNIAVVPKDLDGQLTSTGIAVLRPNEAVNPRYLFNWACSDSFVEAISMTQDGTMYPAVSDRDVAEGLIRVPPLPEQQRIVEKIDSLCAKSRRALGHLDHIPRLVEKYKQAILGAAFSGELTREKRASPAKSARDGVRSMAIDGRLSTLPDLPSSWRWMAISELMEIGGGLTKNPARSAMAMRRPYLRVANVYANELRLAEISETGCTEKEFEKTKLASGDLLIVEGNGSLDQIGRVALWNGEVSDCSHQNHIIRARPSELVEPRYALFWLLSPAGREAIETVASSSSGLHTLSITKVERLPIPLCAKPEQRAIVRSIDNAFTWIDRLASETTKARKLVDHLDQAILAKAFRGELVPQDPNDEPASVLLERIRAERGATAHPKKRRDKSSSRPPARSRRPK
ncbi:restriction endonuclease subunit S [Bradyrhizobium sp. SHOUNA76]|uniref:restriction endonuclease subunit S n=1 Tax=Bradyrhizobium sp. SHOUNA76 TaxID=2908927 RepID=UPI001FF5C050|nr:restriction endonuclease subunit S [Bradyrhizobium sp. SHOUNA76]MCJ9700860.1 restriction endonuclease subunit S [Bradyrhizobium sp. SHOUNA76]